MNASRVARTATAPLAQRAPADPSASVLRTLKRRLQRTQTTNQLLATYYRNRSSVDPLRLMVTLTRLATLSAAEKDFRKRDLLGDMRLRALVADLTAHLTSNGDGAGGPHMPQLNGAADEPATVAVGDGRSVSSVAWGLAKLNLSSADFIALCGHDLWREVFHKAAKALERGTLGPSHVAQLMWAAGRSKHRHEGFIDGAIASLGACLSEYRPEELATITWALAEVGCGSPGVFSAIAEHMTHHRIDDLSPGGLSCLVRGLSVADCYPDALLHRAVRSATSLLDRHEWDATDMSDLAQFAASIARTPSPSVKAPAFFCSLASYTLSLLDQPKHTKLYNRELSIIVWSFAASHQYSYDLFRRTFERDWTPRPEKDDITPIDESREAIDPRRVYLSYAYARLVHPQPPFPPQLSPPPWLSACRPLMQEGLGPNMSSSTMHLEVMRAVERVSGVRVVNEFVDPWGFAVDMALVGPAGCEPSRGEEGAASSRQERSEGSGGEANSRRRLVRISESPEALLDLTDTWGDDTDPRSAIAAVSRLAYWATYPAAKRASRPTHQESTADEQDTATLKEAIFIGIQSRAKSAIQSDPRFTDLLQRLTNQVVPPTHRGVLPSIVDVSAFGPRDWGAVRGKVLSAGVGVEDMAMLAVAAANGGLLIDGVLKCLGEVLVGERMFDTASPKHLVDIAWNFHKLGILSLPLAQAVTSQILQRPAAFTPRNLATISQAVSQYAAALPEYMGFLPSVIRERSADIESPRDLALILWTLARPHGQAAGASPGSDLLDSPLSLITEDPPVGAGRATAPMGTSPLDDASDVFTQSGTLLLRSGVFASATAQDIAMLAATFSRVNVVHPELFGEISKMMQQQQQQPERGSSQLRWKPIDISTVMVAMTRLGWRDDALLMACASMTSDRLDEFSPDELSHVLWALGKWRSNVTLQPAQSLLRRVTASLPAMAHHYGPAQLAGILWSWAAHSTSIASPTQLASVCAAIARSVTPRLHGDVDVRALCLLAWGMARAGVSVHEPNEAIRAFYREMTSVSMARLHEFGPRDLANLAYAMTSGGVHGREVYERLATASLPVVSKCAPIDAAHLMWGFSKAGWLHPPLFRAVADHLLSTRALLTHTSNAVDDSYIVWSVLASAFTEAGLCHAPLLNHIREWLTPHVVSGRFPTDNLLSLIWHFVKSGIDCGEAILQTAVERLGLRDGNEGVNTERGECVGVGMAPSKHHVAAFLWCLAMARQLPAFPDVVRAGMGRDWSTQSREHITDKERSMIYQVHLACVVEGLDESMRLHGQSLEDCKAAYSSGRAAQPTEAFPRGIESLALRRDAAKRPWESHRRRAVPEMSNFHRHMSRFLTGLGVPHINEGVTEEGISVDIEIRDNTVSGGGGADGGGETIAIELDGPSHFLYRLDLPDDADNSVLSDGGPTRQSTAHCQQQQQQQGDGASRDNELISLRTPSAPHKMRWRHPTPTTLFKRWVLEGLGWRVISVSLFELDPLWSDPRARMDYLLALLHASQSPYLRRKVPQSVQR
ncbi:unnamed protein product [Vitrella brassicaformis CCMP3155]|uniref:RAP domain-containing protein n=2 Tax=Vitrella brassicaformis TaxID=1169539 RepID=A0A0G4GFU6_VITBC|nr:unnamed protein product [Vitrella brassicaformis CCMP3155]|eukprot:CEM28381.1 unnamed protein product [Vitrella brassicaformis CCMP3155]